MPILNTFTSAAARAFKSFISSAVDPFFSNVGLLLHLDTSFADSSLSNITCTSYGSPVISSVQSKFGGGSLLLNGSSNLQYTEQTSAFIGSGDFTVEFWVYKTSNSIARSFSSTSSIFIQDSSTFGLRLFWSSPEVQITSASTLPLNTWTYFAVTRQGNTFRIFINGTLSATATASLTTSTLGQGNIGGIGVLGEFFNGYIDEFRLTKGVARYTSSFTAPTAPFPNS
jgi:hypothetical protein